MENLKNRFSSENQPPNRGRKPSKLKKYIQDCDLSSTDIQAAMQYMLDKSEDEIEGMANDKNVPMMMRLFAKAMTADMKGSNLTNILKMLDRAVEKTHKFEVTGAVANPEMKLSEEEQQQFNGNIMALFGQKQLDDDNGDKES